MAFPNSTGPRLDEKATTYDVTTSTANFLNGADWNRMRTHVHSLIQCLVGSYRGFVERRSAGTLSAVSMHTASLFVDGYRKTVASARILIPAVTGMQFVWIRCNTGAATPVVKTAAIEPSPYATTTRDLPIAKVQINLGKMTITHTRPDWALWARHA